VTWVFYMLLGNWLAFRIVGELQKIQTTQRNLFRPRLRFDLGINRDLVLNRRGHARVNGARGTIRNFCRSLGAHVPHPLKSL